MTYYVRDREQVAEALQALRADIEYAKYAFAMGCNVARSMGLTWAQVGEMVGLTGPGVSQLVKRMPNGYGLGYATPEEVDRFARMLGAGNAQPRFEVRRITSGRVGLTKVERETVSRHLKRSVAEDQAEQVKGWAGQPGEVWKVEPTGEETRLVIRPVHLRRPQLQDDEEAF